MDGMRKQLISQYHFELTVTFISEKKVRPLSSLVVLGHDRRRQSRLQS